MLRCAFPSRTRRQCPSVGTRFAQQHIHFAGDVLADPGVGLDQQLLEQRRNWAPASHVVALTYAVQGMWAPPPALQGGALVSGRMAPLCPHWWKLLLLRVLLVMHLGASLPQVLPSFPAQGCLYSDVLVQLATHERLRC
jgi:hypothetical protein